MSLLPIYPPIRVDAADERPRDTIKMMEPIEYRITCVA
jgi:hypothetical protein